MDESREIVQVRAATAPSDRIVQSNQFVRAVYNLPAPEKRIFSLLLSKIDPDATSIPTIVFDQREMADTLGMDYKGALPELRRLCRKTVKRGISIGKDDYDDWQETTFYTLSYSRSAGTLSFNIPEDLKPHILQLRASWTAIPANIAVQMTGKYTARIFENIMSWKGTGKAKGKEGWTAALKMADLKQMFMLTDKYKLAANFTRDVIRPAVDEINSLCEDMKVTFVTKVVGGSRKVDHYLFTVQVMKDGLKPAPQPTQAEEEEDELTPAQKDRLGVIIEELKHQPDLPGMEHENPIKRNAWVLKEAIKRVRAEAASEKRKAKKDTATPRRTR